MWLPWPLKGTLKKFRPFYVGYSVPVLDFLKPSVPVPVYVPRFDFNSLPVPVPVPIFEKKSVPVHYYVPKIKIFPYPSTSTFPYMGTET